MRFTCRQQIKLETEKPFFGPGVSQLLHGIEMTGSLQKATRSMGMAYSKGWKILNEAERNLGYLLVCRHSGGNLGGSSSLTEEGSSFLSRYDDLEKDAETYLQDRFKALFPEAFA